MNQEKIYDNIILFSYVLMFLSYLNIYNNAPHYLEIINYYINIYICLFLIYRFNPFQNKKTNSLDKKIAFHGGIILFSNSVTGILIKSILEKKIMYNQKILKVLTNK